MSDYKTVPLINTVYIQSNNNGYLLRIHAKLNLETNKETYELKITNDREKIVYFEAFEDMKDALDTGFQLTINLTLVNSNKQN